MKRSRGVSVLIGLLLPALALAEEAAPLPSYLSYEGTAVEPDDGSVLYRESHYVAMQGDRAVERLVLYRCADGTPFARKRVADNERLPWLPEFEMTDARLGYIEGAAATADAVQVYVREPGETQTEREALGKLPQNLVGDAGFDRFVQDQWARLLAGQTVHFHFLVPSRLDYLGFKVRHIGSQRIGDTPVEVFRLALGGLLGLIVSGIDVAYDAESRILMRFEGLSNVRDPAGDNYVVRIDFPPEARRAEDNADALEAARTVPLASTCAM